MMSPRIAIRGRKYSESRYQTPSLAVEYPIGKILDGDGIQILPYCFGQELHGRGSVR